MLDFEDTPRQDHNPGTPKPTTANPNPTGEGVSPDPYALNKQAEKTNQSGK